MGDGEKIVNDPIHNIIILKRLWVKIIDTMEFQRLRYIKQLGCTYFVYPSATNTRFEHSIGVCYLADRMVRHLRTQVEQSDDPLLKDLQVTEEDCLCVSVAGLCHDLGHGAYSHLWERFMKLAAPDKKWKHEHVSVQLFERIWNKLKDENEKVYELGEDDKKRIGDMIIGNPPKESQEIPQRKHFLYEIVANKKSGMDVDKWDYLCRDIYYLGFGQMLRVQYERLLKFARVEVDANTKESAIWYRDSERLHVHQMFYTRWLLHRRAYNHRVTRIMERMIIDALLEADKDLDNLTNLTKGKKLSEMSDDLDTYLRLNDSILHWLKTLREDHPAKKLVERVERRDLYKCVGCFFSPVVVVVKRNDSGESVEEVIEESVLEKEIGDHIRERTGDDFYVDVAKFDYGMGMENPMEKVSFYSKNQTGPNENQPSRMLPNEFKEYQIMCVSRDPDENKRKNVKREFEDWFNEHKEERKLFDFTMPNL